MEAEMPQAPGRRVPKIQGTPGTGQGDTGGRGAGWILKTGGSWQEGAGHRPEEGPGELPCPWLLGLSAWGASVQVTAGGWEGVPLHQSSCQWPLSSAVAASGWRAW